MVYPVVRLGLGLRIVCPGSCVGKEVLHLHLQVAPIPRGKEQRVLVVRGASRLEGMAPWVARAAATARRGGREALSQYDRGEDSLLGFDVVYGRAVLLHPKPPAPGGRGTRGEIEEIGVEDITSRATTSACTYSACIATQVLVTGWSDLLLALELLM